MWPCAQLKLPLVLLVSWLDGATFEKGKKTKNKNNQRPNTFGICSVSQLGPNISKQWCGCLGSTKPAVMVMAINFNLSTRRFWSKSVLVTRLLHSHVQLTSIINLAQAQTELKYKSKYADARTTLYFPNHLGVNSLRRCSKEWRVGGSRVILQTTHVPTKCSPATLRNKQVKNLNKVHWKGSSFFFFFKKKALIIKDNRSITGLFWRQMILLFPTRKVLLSITCTPGRASTIALVPTRANTHTQDSTFHQGLRWFHTKMYDKYLGAVGA